LSILPSTQLYRNANKYNIIKIDSDFGVGTDWVNQDLNISPEQREIYHSELKKICVEECNFVVV
jgi:hypothetical protein